MQTDLQLAKQQLIQKKLSLVVAKRGKALFETETHGINGLLDAIKELENDMRDSSVADRIVGRAAALLFVYSGVIAVFAVTASEGGVEVLKENKILHEFERLVPRILDSKKLDICPFEKLVSGLSEPKKAYDELKARCTPKQAL